MTEARSKKQEGPTDDCQKPEDGRAAEQAFLLASGFLLLASSAKLNEPRRIALPDRGSDASACL
jgi:hypothetical protein